MNDFGGLWKTVQEVDFNLMKIECEKKKTEALKCQLKFRQKIMVLDVF